MEMTRKEKKCRVESVSNLAQMQRKIARKGEGKKLRKKVATNCKTGKDIKRVLKQIKKEELEGKGHKGKTRIDRGNRRN